MRRVAFVSGVPEKLVPFGKQTVLYNIHYKGELTRNDVRYIFPGYKRWQLAFPVAYNFLIRDIKPDVVLVHGLIFPWQIIMLRKTIGPNVKIICQHHAERPFKDLRAWICRKADEYIGAYLFASKAQGEEWVKAGQISSMSKVHEIMGTSSIFHPDNRNRTGNNYLWIGDLDANKDPLTVVRAFNEFSNNHPTVELNMIFQNEMLLESIRKVAKPNIHLVGKVDHDKMGEWFNRSDYIISTSHYEGSGIAVCEAMSCGCIPVVTNIPSFRTMTADGKIGRLFDAGDVPGLVNALEETSGISQSRDVIDHFNAELSFEANARKIMGVIKQLS